MHIVAKTGFDISNIKSCLLGENVKKYFKMSSAEKKKKKKKEKKKKIIPRLLRIKLLAFSIYLYNENPSFFKMSFKMSFLTFYMFESLDGLWVGGGAGWWWGWCGEGVRTILKFSNQTNIPL